MSKLREQIVYNKENNNNNNDNKEDQILNLFVKHNNTLNVSNFSQNTKQQNLTIVGVSEAPSIRLIGWITKP